MEKTNGRCSYCGKAEEYLEIDHMIPRAQGGTNHIENLTPACFRCNSSKRNRTVDQFRRKLMLKRYGYNPYFTKEQIEFLRFGLEIEIDEEKIESVLRDECDHAKFYFEGGNPVWVRT